MGIFDGVVNAYKKHKSEAKIERDNLADYYKHLQSKGIKPNRNNIIPPKNWRKNNKQKSIREGQ